MPLSNYAKIAIGWAICVTLGISSFAGSKKYVDSQRYENMKARERMRLSNIGEYEPSYRKF